MEPAYQIAVVELAGVCSATRHPSSRGLVFPSRGVVFRDLPAVTMRSCARLTSDKLTRCFGRSTAGRTTHGQCISGSGFLLHVGDYDAPNPKRTYVQFFTIKVSASPFRNPNPKRLGISTTFFGHAANLKSLRYLAVHPPPTQVLVGRTAPERARRGCLLVTVGTVPACGSRSLASALLWYLRDLRRLRGRER